MKLYKDAREGIGMIVAGVCFLAVMSIMLIVIHVLIGDASPHGVWAWIVNIAVIYGTIGLVYHLCIRDRKPERSAKP